MKDTTRWLMTLCLAQLFIMLVFINYSAVLPQLKSEWGMNNTMAGSIFSVYQLGYIAAGVILSTLTDRYSVRLIFICAALWSGTANLLFALFAHDYPSALLLRALTGIGMGGTYMPGLRLVAERFQPAERGRAIGIYVGSLVLGASLSLGLTGVASAWLGWRMAFILCSVGVYLGTAISLLVFIGYRHSPPPPKTMTCRQEVLRNRPAILMIFGYGAHMWEMYSMRSWLAPFLTALLIHHGLPDQRATGTASLVAAMIIGVGTIATAVTGTLSDRIGRTATISMVMIGSGIFSLFFGWLFTMPPWLTISVAFIYGYLVVAESPVFSTGLTELVATPCLGAAMGLQSLIGYSLGMISPTVFGWSLDIFSGMRTASGLAIDWGIAFATAGAGAFMGPLFMLLLRRQQESRAMAGGRR
jgi:MFS family permease